MVAEHFDAHGLRALPLFKGLDEEEVAELEAVSSVVDHARGSAIFRAGEPSQALYVILRGQVDVRMRDRDGEEHSIVTLGPGAVLGEMALLTDDVHSATAVAVADVLLLCLPASIFSFLLNQGRRSAYQVGYNLGRVAAARLRQVNKKLLGALAEHEAGPPRLEELSELRRKLFTEWQF